MMFANLKKKIKQEGGTIYENSETHCGPGVASPASRDVSAGENLPRTASIDSLDSVGDQLRPSRRRDEHIKKLEGKVTELAGMVREKNAKIAELDKVNKQVKDEQERANSKLKESFMTEIQTLWADHQKKLEESLKNADILSSEIQSQLESQLREAEANIDSYKEKYFKKEEETDEIHDLTKQELGKIKHMLLNKEKEIQFARDSLAEVKAQLKASKHDAESAQQEVQVNRQTVQRLQEERQRDCEERRSQQTTIKGLLNDKEELERRVDDVTATLQKTRNMLSNVERSCISTQDKYQACQRELDTLRNKHTVLKEEKDEREEDYKDRIRVLEARVNEADLDSDERIKVLQNERCSLETKLSEAKAQLSEAKAIWSERIRQLESQIANLNEKMAEDSAEITQHMNEREDMRSGFERQIADLQQRLHETEGKIIELEESLTSKEYLINRHETEQDYLRNKLTSTQESMQQKLNQLTEQLNNERTEFKTEKTELLGDLDRANKERKEVKDNLNKAEKEINLIKEQLNGKTEEAENLGKDRFSKDLKLTELKADLSRMEVECEDTKRKLDGAKSEIKTLQGELKSHLDNKKQLVNSLESLRSELETTKSSCERRVVKLQMEYDAKARECELANLSVRELKEKIEDIELERETVIVNMEREEVQRLKAEIQGLEGQIVDKNKTIKLQQQRLSDLKKALQRELRVQTLPNEDQGPLLSVLQSGGQPAGQGGSQLAQHRRVSSNESSTLGFGAVSNGFSDTPPRPVSSASGSAFAFPDHPAFSMSVGAEGAVSAAERSLSTLSEVNFTYLKHVLLKFLLSRESEAVHLVRAISTLLKFTPEEERLLKETMEYKMSWFGMRPRMSSQGQRSKHIPP